MTECKQTPVGVRFSATVKQTRPPTFVALHGCMHKGHRNTLEPAHAGSL